MAIGDISLTAGMRNNLLALQSTDRLIQTTQNRLSTGKKVNTPLDNPTNYFAAQDHYQRAGDLAIRKDAMSEAIQTLKAADSGVKGITTLIKAAQGVASSASATGITNDKSAYANTFNTLRSQINTLASDSGYRGTNLLAAGSLTVEFGQITGTSNMAISGFNATTGGALSIGAQTGTLWAASNTNIDTAAKSLESALSTLRKESSNLSANLSVVTTRQDFTDSIINTLQVGADNLTLADTNEEGANMLMLQTRQNLGISSLSMASQAAQAVLRLF